LCYNNIAVNIGAYNEEKKDRVYGHPLLVAHYMRVMPQTATNPHKAYQYHHAVSRQEHNRDELLSPIHKLSIFSSRDYPVDPGTNQDEISYADERYTKVTDLTGDSPDFVVLGQCLVISAKHFSYFKVPVCKQEMRNLEAAVGNRKTNHCCQIQVVRRV